jgi:hypothetical protein
MPIPGKTWPAGALSSRPWSYEVHCNERLLLLALNGSHAASAVWSLSEVIQTWTGRRPGARTYRSVRTNHESNAAAITTKKTFSAS